MGHQIPMLPELPIRNWVARSTTSQVSEGLAAIHSSMEVALLISDTLNFPKSKYRKIMIQNLLKYFLKNGTKRTSTINLYSSYIFLKFPLKY